MHLPTSTKLAIKRVDNVFDNVGSCRRLLREVQLLRAMGHHRNIISLADVIEPSGQKSAFNSLYYAFEYMPMNLLQLMCCYEKLTAFHVKVITFNVMCGLKFMHSAGVMHRDLKADNILVDKKCTAKICDFGMARQTSDLVNPKTVLHGCYQFVKENKYTEDSENLSSEEVKKVTLDPKVFEAAVKDYKGIMK